MWIQDNLTPTIILWLVVIVSVSGNMINKETQSLTLAGRTDDSDDEYVLGSVGDIRCPEFYVDISTDTDCQKAANDLGISGWNGEKLDNHDHRMPYCWVGGGGKANFNGKGDTGSDPSGSGSTLICKRETHYIREDGQSCFDEDYSRSYITLVEAQTKCNEDIACKGVADKYCDDRKYWICKGGRKPTSSACSWWKAQAYVKGVTGSNVCPVSSKAITEPNVCEEAGTAFNLTFDQEDAWDDKPKGCYENGTYVYFNTHEEGSGHDDLTPICQTVGPACYANDDCDVTKGEVCGNEGLFNATCVVPACNANNDCENGEVCGNEGLFNAECVVPACNANDDCDVASGEVCVNEGLFNAECGITKCYCEHANGTTPNAKHLCKTGSYVEINGACVNHQRCTGATDETGGVDVNQRSQLCSKIPCSDLSDCPVGFWKCVNGFCKANSWKLNPFLKTGTTCSKSERYDTYNNKTLEKCKTIATNLKKVHIYYQTAADRPNHDVSLCHIYSSCKNTRTPAFGGTNYMYFGVYYDQESSYCKSNISGWEPNVTMTESEILTQCTSDPLCAMVWNDGKEIDGWRMCDYGAEINGMGATDWDSTDYEDYGDYEYWVYGSLHIKREAKNCDTNNGGCQQICTNNDAFSVVCSCYAGTLNSDGTTCDRDQQGFVWRENLDFASGETCSVAERVDGFLSNLADCKANATSLGYTFIFFQDIDDRPNGEYCHIYSSCENTRAPGRGGTNYIFGDSPCNTNNGWCEQICTDSGTTNVICSCYSGTLADDKQNCDQECVDTPNWEDNFGWSCADYAKEIPSVIYNDNENATDDNIMITRCADESLRKPTFVYLASSLYNDPQENCVVCGKCAEKKGTVGEEQIGKNADDSTQVTHNFNGHEANYYARAQSCSVGNDQEDADYFCKSFYGYGFTATSYVVGTYGNSGQLGWVMHNGCANRGEDIDGTNCSNQKCKIMSWNNGYANGMYDIICQGPRNYRANYWDNY